jgi:tetratricopeptide (TPR) repeat protein
MYGRVAQKRHDDIVHDVDEVWRSLRRTLLLLRSARGDGDSGDRDSRAQAAAALRFTVGIFNFVEEIDLITLAHLLTIFAEIFQILEDFAEADRMYREAHAAIVKNYGASHLAVSDHYVMMSAVKAKQGKINDAIEYSGKALVIRTGSLGLIHDKVGHCHYNLGLLYRLSGDLKNSLKHFKICRGIRRNLFLEVSREVALADMSVGQTEQWMVMYDKAYFSFYNSYRTYCVLCGVASQEARAVLAYLRQLRYSYGTRFTSIVELRDIVAALEFEYDTTEKFQDDVFLQDLLSTMESENKLVLNAMEMKFMIFNVLADGKFDREDSPFLEGLAAPAGGGGVSDQKLAAAVFSELSQPISEASLSIVFQKEGRLVALERKKLDDKFAQVQNENAKRNVKLLPSIAPAMAEPERRAAAASGPSPSPSPARTRSVHFSFEHNTVHELQGQGGGQAGAADENADDTINVNPTLHRNSPEVEDKTKNKTESSKKSQNFFSRVLAANAFATAGGDGGSGAPESPSPPPSPAHSDPCPSPEPEASPPSPSSPLLFDSPPDSPGAPPTSAIECNFCLGSRSLLILHDMDGRGVAIRPVTEADVMAALKPKLLAFGNFIYLLQQSKKAAASAAEGAAAEGPVPTRDASKPLDPPPPPPPLPVGWPPQAPSGDDDAKPSQMSLSSVFKGSGAAPPPGGGQRRASVTPTLKLKQVHWDAVTLPSAEGTVWDTGPSMADGLSVVDHASLFPDLVAEFEIAKVGALTRTSAEPSPAAAAKKVTKNILDPKRSQNMTIMLSKFRKTSPAVIARAVLELDTSAFEQSVIQGMLDQVPTPEEHRAVKKYFEEHGEDVGRLDKAEHYVLETSRVPLMSARLTLMNILLSLEDCQHAVESGTALIFAACGQLQGSARYRRLMHVILTVGNLLNKGSKKSSAMGFRLSSLSKFVQTKSNAGVSLMDYVVGHLLKQEAEVLELSSEFTCLQEAKQTSFVSISAEIAKLSVGISVGWRIVESTESDPGMREVSEKIREGVGRINGTVQRLEALCADAVSRFNATCVYLGEQVSDPATLFGQLIALLDSLDKSSREVQAKLRRAAVASDKAGAHAEASAHDTHTAGAGAGVAHAAVPVPPVRTSLKGLFDST